MPNTKSAKKALRQSLKKKAANLKRKTKIKKIVKEIKNLAGLGKKDEANKLISDAYRALDKAVKSKTIKKNTAARKKSRLTKLIRASK